MAWWLTLLPDCMGWSVEFICSLHVCTGPLLTAASSHSPKMFISWLQRFHEARLIGGSNTHRCGCLSVFLCVLIIRILTCGWLLMLDSFSFSQFTSASLFKTFMLSWARGMIRLFDLLLQMFLRCRARPPQFTGKLCVFTPAKSFDANDMLACGGEFAPLSACATVSILCLHEMDRLIIRHDQRLVWAKHSGNKAKGWSSLHHMVSQSEIQRTSQYLEHCSSKHFLNRFLLYDRSFILMNWGTVIRDCCYC